jgi:hypothetical protein
MSGGTFGTNWLDYPINSANRYMRTYIQGFMDISGGNLIIRQNNLYLTQGDASINGNLILGYDASLNKRLFVGSDASFGGKVFITSDLSINGTLSASSIRSGSGTITLPTSTDTLATLTGTETLTNKTITTSGLLTAGAGLTVTGDTTTSNRLFVTNDSSLNGNVYIAKDLTVNGNLAVKQYSTNLTVYTVSYEFIVAQDMSLNGRLYLYDDLSANKRLFLGGDASLNSRLFINGDASFNSRIFVGADCNINGNVIIGNGTTSNITITPGYYYNGSTLTALTNSMAFDLGGTGSTGLFSFSDKVAFMGGNVGIGTTNPSYSLDITGNLRSTGTTYLTGGTASTSTTTGTLQVTGGAGITGNVCVGSNIFIKADGAQSIFITDTPGTSTGTTSYGRLFGTGGNVFLDYYGSIQFRNSTLAGITSTTSYVYANGQISATSFNATSDYRIKSDIQILDGSYNVDCLHPVTYIHKGLNKREVGFVAHEIQEHYPFLVDGEKDDEKYQTLNYLGLIGILTKEIQDLKKQNKDFAERLEKAGI